MIARLSLALALLSAPGIASACAVCSDPNDPRNQAYFDMTIFMSLFPLLAMGVIAWWLHRRYSTFEAEDPAVR